ncbi:hypothetical protein niasHS_001655 [Heterodera schachtii]|uniref:Uncharacterized protein n=1 Tax=Heterodera schachtii TaxID=97005 RepID=A0ABD2KC74_HETSC
MRRTPENYELLQKSYIDKALKRTHHKQLLKMAVKLERRWLFGRPERSETNANGNAGELLSVSEASVASDESEEEFENDTSGFVV